MQWRTPTNLKTWLSPWLNGKGSRNVAHRLAFAEQEWTTPVFEILYRVRIDKFAIFVALREMFSRQIWNKNWYFTSLVMGWKVNGRTSTARITHCASECQYTEGQVNGPYWTALLAVFIFMIQWMRTQPKSTWRFCHYCWSGGFPP